MQKRINTSWVSLLFVLLTGILQARKVNVILMIADGWGYNQILATDYWNGSKAGYEDWETAYAMSTFKYGENYDGVEAWSDFDYVKLHFTDSAAAATAMSTLALITNADRSNIYSNVPNQLVWPQVS
jgi:alkaline phosphatase